MAQFARPDSNVTQTSVTGGFTAIDESAASDADFAFGADNAAAELEVGLSNVTDPQSSSGHTFRYRIAKTDDGTVNGSGSAVTVTARLMQGTTQIATDTAKTATGTWTQYSYTLTSGEADAITDYSDLRLEFLTSASGGSPANRRGGAVSWAELEVPDAPASNNYQHSESGSISPSGSIVRRTRRAIAATLGPSGSLVRRTRRALTAAVSPAGSLVRRTGHRQSADLTFDGALATSYQPAPTPALTAVLIRSI